MGSGVSASSGDGATSAAAGTVTREVVARVTTTDELDEGEKDTARRLIRLNVPGLTRVEFISHEQGAQTG